MSSLSELSEKMDSLIKIQAALATAEILIQKDKIFFLHKAGLAPKLISEIVGTSANTVNVTISRAKKAGEV